MAKIELRTVSIEDTRHFEGAHIKILRVEEIYTKLTLTPNKKKEDSTDVFLIEPELIDLHIAIGQFLELKARERNTAEMTTYIENSQSES